MANYDLTRGGTIGVSEQDARKHVLFANTVSFVTQNVLATDIAQLINIPATFWMTMFGVRLDVAEGATATGVFGDGTTAGGWLGTAFDLNGAVNTFKQSGLVLAEATPNTFVDVYHPGKYYAAADTIDLDPGHDLDACVITVWASGFILDPTYIIPAAA
jgi:hypothetical protein